MFDAFLNKLKELFSSRLVYLSILIIVLFSILVGRMYSLQILAVATEEGTPATGSDYQSYRLRYNDSVRGNIYDRNGNLLAYNVLSYNIVMSNSANYSSNAERNAMIAKLIDIIERNGYELELDFPIYIDENGEFAFNLTGNSLLRFKKNAYCLPSVKQLTEEQIEASAEDVFNFLKYGNKTSPMFGISDEYPPDLTLKIMTVRYALLTLYPQYSQFTICSDVDGVTIAAIEENSAELKGVEIRQVTSRVYNDSLFFAHILGYTGKATEEEAEALNADLEEDMYNTSTVIGKTGIEKEMDSLLRGQSGVEELSVSVSGKIISSTVKSSPVAGDDIYLTIDRELQIACYHILENNIAAILLSKIVNSMSYGGKGDSASKITIPIYEVYNAFIANSVLDISHFQADDATELEQKIYSTYKTKEGQVLDKLHDILSYDSPTINSKLTDEYEGYIDYIYSMLRSDQVLRKDLIDQKDKTYISYTEDKISLSEFLQYAIDMQWIDLAKLGIGSDYNTNNEVYDKLMAYVFEKLYNNTVFEKMIYRVLIFNYKISGKDMCLLLYDQGVLEYNENDYKRLKNGRIGAYYFVKEKITNLEITPGMLALEPCSGSIVITDVNTGDVLAMVTYPSYDNNMLANKIDWKYYSKLLANNATPLLNRPTQQLTATGSTFKPLMALAGMAEGVITTQTKIKDEGLFELVDPSPKCWKYPGNHGWINLTQAIQHSCNYFFYMVGYQMSLDAKGEYSDSLGISKIQKYAAMFGLADRSGVEVPESMPAISSTDAVRTSIGYYHNFAPIQISRYVTAVANKGTVFNLTIVDKTVNKDSGEETDNSATVFNQIDLYSNTQWTAVQKGMYDVVNTSANSLNTLYGDLGFKVAGKTGTAQVSLTHPSHGLFISFAPYSSPEVSVTIVIPNGYASANAAKLAREVYGLYFNDENKEELLSGDLTTTNVTNITVSD
ncbi:MAG: hypothetical protein IK001_07120 [Lachnospiraceae bacterium]|nr:hypothetical protein [Lachnospiraceae bacterium]